MLFFLNIFIYVISPFTFIIEYIVNIIFIFIFVCGKRENNIDIYLTEKEGVDKVDKSCPKIDKVSIGEPKNKH